MDEQITKGPPFDTDGRPINKDDRVTHVTQGTSPGTVTRLVVDPEYGGFLTGVMVLWDDDPEAGPQFHSLDGKTLHISELRVLPREPPRAVIQAVFSIDFAVRHELGSRATLEQLKAALTPERLLTGDLENSVKFASEGVTVSESDEGDPVAYLYDMLSTDLVSWKVVDG